MQASRWFYIRIFLALSGIWNVLDGVASILSFSTQPYFDQIGRVVRTLIGLILIIIAMKWPS